MLRFNSNKAGRIRELIDTLWNVNIDGMVLGYKDIGINRNIVECK